MKPLNSHSIIEALALGTVPVVGAFLIWATFPVHGVIKQTGQGSAQILAKFGVALDTVNHACSPGPCGTLAEIDKFVVKSGDAIVTTQIQEQAIGKQVSATMTALQTIPEHVNGTMDSLSGTAQTASTTLQTLSDHLIPVEDATASTVKQVGTTMAGLQPLESAATKTVQDGDALVTSPDVARFLKASADTGQQAAIIATQGAGIATDVHTVTRKYANPPKAKWYQKAWNVAKFGAETLYDFLR